MSAIVLYSHFLPKATPSTLRPSNTSVLCNSSPSNPKQFLLPRYTFSKPRILCSSSKDDNNQSNFCIIEGPETVQDFVQMQLQEIPDNIKSGRNKIFLLMEEVRRLRVQQRLKGMKVITEDGEEADEINYL